MTAKEKLMFLANTSETARCLADSRCCPPWENGVSCETFKDDCIVCWRAWLLGSERAQKERNKK